MITPENDLMKLPMKNKILPFLDWTCHHLAYRNLSSVQPFFNKAQVQQIIQNNQNPEEKSKWSSEKKITSIKIKGVGGSSKKSNADANQMTKASCQIGQGGYTDIKKEEWGTDERLR